MISRIFCKSFFKAHYCEYTIIIPIFFYFQMSTPELIDLYYKERLDDQQSLMHQYHTIGEVPPYGTLCVRVYFRNNCLFVEVIRARNVIPLDR